ncbi:MAG: polysaccharide biosynthesis/export family protein [Planctomycetota bacterium]|nr:polysaccharide biosynthesis/export family protein [Planctomycetota bacterium]
MAMCARRIRLLAALAFAMALSLSAGCTAWSAIANKPEHANEAAEQDRTVVRIVQGDVEPPPPGRDGVIQIQRVSIVTQKAGPPPNDYVIGSGDVLFVRVFGQAEMGSAMGGGNRAIGSTVDGDGYIQLPKVDRVRVAGMTRSQAQVALSEAFTILIQKPSVVVEVVEHHSQPIYLVGQFQSPGVYYLERPTNITQMIAMAHGLNGSAFLAGARLLRGNRMVPVDIYALLYHGQTDQNLWLEPNDTIFVPDSEEQRVLILGAVTRPGPVPLLKGKLNLLEAIAGAGGMERTGSKIHEIRIIRSLSPTTGELIVVDFKRIVDGQAMPYPLLAGDVVVIPRSKLGAWNDTLKEALPSFQAFSAIVSPFAQFYAASQGKSP